MAKTKQQEASAVITDPLMEPYFITMDDYNYTLGRRYAGEKGHTATIGYYKSIGSCLQAVATLLSKQQSYSSIQEYLTNYDQIVSKLTVLNKYE